MTTAQDTTELFKGKALLGTLKINDKIEYKLWHCVGGGAFGKVYIVKNQNGRLSALKQIELKPVEKADQLAQFCELEVKVLMKLDHPNIVKCFGGYRYGKNRYYIDMEYLSGTNLEDHLKELRETGQTVSHDQCIKWFLAMVSALKHLDDQHIVHRDIKPANIMIDDKQQLKLVDFGLAACFETEERSTFCGTFPYMAPEVLAVALNHPVTYTSEADMWSFGCVMFELLTGRDITVAQDGTLNMWGMVTIIGDCPNILQQTIKCPDFLRLMTRILDFDRNTRIAIAELAEDPIVVAWMQQYK